MLISPASPSRNSVRRSSPYLVADFLQLVDDDLHEQALAREDGAEALDRLQQLGQLVEDLLALQARQALELHVEDGLRLDLRQAELHHQAVARLGHGLRRANQRNHLVEVVERNPQPFEDVVSRLGLPELELGPPPDDLAPELDEALDELEQAQDLRPAADDRQHDDAEARLQRRVLVEVVEDDLRHFPALELDDDPHALAVRLVAQVGDAFDGLLADQIRDALDQLGLVDLIRNLGEDDRRPVALLVRLGRRAGAHHDRAAARRERLHGAGAADDVAAGREVGTGNQADQLPELVGAGDRLVVLLEVRVLDQPDAAVDDLAEVVRRDVGGHPDGDAGGPVDQQVRERRRENGRLFGGLVVVRNEVDGLLVEIRHHVVGERFEPRFRVPHRRGRVAVDRSEIALPVHQRVAHVEVLRHADERVVDGGVAVGMEVAHHLADDLRALAIAARRRQPHRLHAVQHAAMRGLQAVAGVGQRSSNDYAHGVIHVRTLHLVFDVDRVQRGYEVGHSWGRGLGAEAEVREAP